MLDFNQVATQMASFSLDQVNSTEMLRAAIREAATRLHNAGPAWSDVQAKIKCSHTSWLMPLWREQPGRTFAAPPNALACTVLATDGSQIVADRHDLALCYLINIGYITLRYGPNPYASLRSHPTLATPDDTLLSDYHGDQDPIAPKRLAMHCRLHEIGGLAELIEEEACGRTAQIPTLAMCDGSLILWQLENERDDEYRDGMLTSFQQVLEIGRSRRTPIVGYISKPMSKDVVNSLRVSVCPFDSADCDRNCPSAGRPRPEYVAPVCAGTERVTDADLFGLILAPGERSAVFESGSKILEKYDPRHRIAFFYLHSGREIARVEIPSWAAADAELLAQAHAVCYDQARKGDGYPVALAEAHEQAIVRGAERSAFFHLMERHFVADHIPVGSTQKALAKRARRV